MAQTMEEGGSPTQAAGGVTPRKLQRADTDPASRALARAFYDDPMIEYIWPDERMRGSLLPIFMRGAIKLTNPYGETFTTAGAPEGAALFLPPGKTKIPTVPMLRILLPDIWRWRPGSFMRFMGIVNEFEHLHPSDAHWYLMVLGVDPPRQGQGIGGMLMSDVLGRADADRLPVYLETLKPRNVTFYEKHGFAVREHFNCHGGKGPEAWTMLRAPS